MEYAGIAITRAVEGETPLNFRLTISFHMCLPHNKAQNCSPSGYNFKNFSALPQLIIQGLSMENAGIAITRVVEGEHL